ncbi:Bicoid-interacting protein 3-domain-containing protein [Massariosphaeria phaeospora]|uniref:RNA methyltransferase n=1 Tax=Massariosphaeria phaeospora TaxID=100035 RepID=A0A7C8MD22_9PLEO|nr:Bicoid-interacting protein 3-domain-containing protein [Massariosphaeria phaeospora]
MPTAYGNYHNYNGPASRFPGFPPSSHVRDARLTMLESLVPGLFTAKHCLDIGCNAGTVSCQLAVDFEATSVTGVDIDSSLVNQAENLLALRSSRVRPPIAESSKPIVDYFPVSAVLTHGYRVEPASKTSRSSPAAPALPLLPRVNFIAADFVLSADPAISGPYDVILALSVIKWIHLEHLDKGLVTFFQKCSSSLASGGYFVIELQTWDSYERAIRPTTAPHFRESLAQLKLRPETSFDEILQEHGLQLHKTCDSLPRRISVYRKV